MLRPQLPVAVYDAPGVIDIIDLVGHYVLRLVDDAEMHRQAGHDDEGKPEMFPPAHPAPHPHRYFHVHQELTT